MVQVPVDSDVTQNIMQQPTVQAPVDTNFIHNQQELQPAAPDMQTIPAPTSQCASTDNIQRNTSGSGSTPQATPPANQPEMTGEINSLGQTFTDINPLNFTVSSLSQAIPNNLKQKIWAREYVDLEQLLKQDDTQQVKVKVSDECQVVFNHAEPKFKITNIEKWMSAFLISSIPSKFKITNIEKWMSAFLISSIPSKALKLFQYMESIRYAAFTFGGTGWLKL